MEKSKISVAMFAVILATVSMVKAEGTIGNLTETTDKMSSIDMNKNFGEAGNVLGSFYSGSTAKGETDSSVVYAERGNSQRAPARSEKEICNAKPSKITLAGKVPPMTPGSGKTGSEEESLPIGAGVLIAGAVALAVSAKNKSYSDDVDTVVHFLLDPFTSNTNPKPPPPNEDYDVHPSGGAPTCNGSNYCTRP